MTAYRARFSVINAREQEIEQTFTIPLASCAGPQGMAIGPHGQILLGCNAPGPSGNSPTAVINERTGEVVATLNNESGSDEVDYNPADNQYFLAESEFTMPGTRHWASSMPARLPERMQALPRPPRRRRRDWIESLGCRRSGHRSRLYADLEHFRKFGLLVGRRQR